MGWVHLSQAGTHLPTSRTSRRCSGLWETTRLVGLTWGVGFTKSGVEIHADDSNPGDLCFPHACGKWAFTIAPLYRFEWSDGEKTSLSSDLVRRRGKGVLLVLLNTEQQAWKGGGFIKSCYTFPGKHLRMHQLNFPQRQNLSTPWLLPQKQEKAALRDISPLPSPASIFLVMTEELSALQTCSSDFHGLSVPCADWHLDSLHKSRVHRGRECARDFPGSFIFWSSFDPTHLMVQSDWKPHTARKTSDNPCGIVNLILPAPGPCSSFQIYLYFGVIELKQSA